MKKYRSLTLRLSLSIIPVVLTVFLAMLILNYGISRRLLVEDALSDARSISTLTAGQIGETLGSVELQANYMIRTLSPSRINSTELEKMLDQLAKNDDRIIRSFSVYYNNDRRINRDNPGFYFNKSEEDTSMLMEHYKTRFIRWAGKLQAVSKPFWTEPYADDDTGELITACIIPANLSHHDSISTRVFIGVELSLKWLKGIIDSGKLYNFETVFILSGEGKIVVSPTEAHESGTDIYQIAKMLNNPEIVGLAEKMMSGNSGPTEVAGIFDDLKSVVYYMPVPSTNWSIAVGFPKNEVLKNLHNTTLKLGIAGVLGLALILLFVVFIAGRLAGPLKELSFSAREIGQGNLKVELPKVKNYDEAQVLRESLQIMQTGLQTFISNLINTEKNKERMENELRIAGEIQMDCLRNDFLAFASGKPFSVMAEIRPTRQTGGDFYDYFMIDEHRLGFAIGDVAGKGVPAALFMTNVLTLIRSADYVNETPGSVVGKINTLILRQNENSVFTTLFIGILNTTTGALNFCNAGHNYPYLLKGGELFEVKATHGPAPGATGGMAYKSGKMKLDHGDKLILYTDGVTYADNGTGGYFGKDRLETLLTNERGSDVSTITKQLMKALRKHSGKTRQVDDLTVLAVEFEGKKGEV